MTKNNVLYLITTHYPFGNSETFIENEIIVLARYFHKIYLVPLYKEGSAIRQTPDNVEIIDCLYKNPLPSGKKVLLPNLLFIVKQLFYEFANINNRLIFLRKSISYISSLLHNIIKSQLLQNKIEKIKDKNAYFYSYWMHDGAIIFSILKQRKIINNYIFRVHGYDLYDYLKEENYIPFRNINLKTCNAVYAISKYGQSYLKSKKNFENKVKHSYLGTFDYGLNPFDKDNKFTLVSCSNICKVKRVNLIVEILKQVKINLKWVHIGDGVDMQDLKEKTEQLPSNIEWEFLGRLNNKKVVDYYANNNINIFINVSESEGLPVSIMEAISFGIPTIATNVGGTSEIVTEKTGILIDENFDVKKTAIEINNFEKSKYNTLEFRKGVRFFWERNFNAEKNYMDFYKDLTET